MRQSQLFTKTRKEFPADEVSKNAQLLIKAGYIHKEMAGVYSYLPLGLRVLEKIKQIIKEEMDNIGGQEVSLTSLQSKEVWQKTDRWDESKVDNWFKTKLNNDTELGLAFTHEEALTNLMKDYVDSYKDLPTYVYQFQTKFRNELRAKSGIMRGREFLMKDLYSFSKDEEEHKEFYEKAKQAYLKIFNRVGLGEYTFYTYADGGVFSKDFSHEFQVVTESGEDVIYLDQGKGVAINKEIYSDDLVDQIGLDKDNLIEKKSVEVGNIFSLGTKYSEALELLFNDKSGKRHPVVMGSYGIGLGRLMGTVVEVLSDNYGIVWPESISPFKIHLICIGDDEYVLEKAESLYHDLSLKYDVLFDDRSKSAGEKLADADLIGIPKRIVISKKTIEQGMVEVKNRKTGEIAMVNPASI